MLRLGESREAIAAALDTTVRYVDIVRSLLKTKYRIVFTPPPTPNPVNPSGHPSTGGTQISNVEPAAAPPTSPETKSINTESNPADAGEIASRAFDLFRKGERPDQVVVELKLPPDYVEDLYDKFVEMRGTSLQPKAIKELYDKLGIPTDRRNFRTLKDRITFLVEYYELTNVPCSKCGRPIELGSGLIPLLVRDFMKPFHPECAPQHSS
jgi:hypothetical protein